MTQSEALKVWLPIIAMGVENMPECKEALEMAIKALAYDDDKYHEEHGEVIVDKDVWEDMKKALSVSARRC